MVETKERVLPRYTEYIPDTLEGLNQYVYYAEKQIAEFQLGIKRLENMLEACRQKKKRIKNEDIS